MWNKQGGQGISSSLKNKHYRYRVKVQALEISIEGVRIQAGGKS
jgi:hypothetical protein